LLFRWVVADHGPEATTSIVPLADVRQHLPASTATITPAQRAATIEARRLHVQRRIAA
jgi:hypothetical protein